MPHRDLASRIASTIHNAHLRYQRAMLSDKQRDLESLMEAARHGVHEQHAVSAHEHDLPTPSQQLAGYWSLFCIHRKAMWMPCFAATCRRSRREANVNLEKLLRGEKI